MLFGERKYMKIFALITSFVMIFGLSVWVNAESLDEVLIDETQVDETIVEETCYETEAEETSLEELITEESLIEENLVEESIGEESIVDELFVEENQDEEIVVEELVEEFTYDVEGYELYGWWVPSMNYNEDDTISFYLEDGTCFLTTPTAGVMCGDSIWQSSGLWNYVEQFCGGEENLTGDASTTYWAVQNSLV